MPGAIGISNAGRFFVSPEQTSRYTVSGVTRDLNGAALGFCTVDVFETVSKAWRGRAISDANGLYAVEIAGDRSLTFFTVDYLTGAPDIFGTSTNTLTAS